MGQIVVEGPDGKKYAFPDTMPREQINAFLRNKYGTKTRDETATQYLQRVGREQKAAEDLRRSKEAQIKDVERVAAGTASEGAMANPGAFYLAGPNAMQSGREASAPIYKGANMVPEDQAFAGGMANAAGLWLPEMLSQPYREGLARARSDQPGWTMAGDFAGGMMSGEVIGAGLEAGVRAVAPRVRQLGAMFKSGKAAAELSPEEKAFSDMVSRIQTRTGREEAERVANEEGLRKAMEMFEPYATPREREMLGLPPRPTAALEDVAPKPKGPYGDGFASPFEELDYVVNTGARADKLTIRQFRDLIESYPPDVVEKYARRMMNAPSGWQMTREDVLDAMQQLYQDAVRQRVQPAGFAAPAGSGKRSSGFLDDTERGTETFYDERLGPVGSDRNKAVEMAKNGYSNDEISEALGATPGTVKVWLSNARKLGIDIPKGYRPGGAATTQTGTRAEILAMKERGLTTEQISKRTGKPPANIRTMLSLERKRLQDAGEPIPIWLGETRRSGSGVGDFAENVFGAGVSSAIGSANPDINGDGVIDETERLIGSGAGLALWASPLALVKAKQLGQMMKSGGR